MFNKEKLVEVLGKIEGHKTRLKELHWSSPSRSMHVIIDDFSSELAEFEDALAENSIALLDFVYTGDLSPKLPEETDFESDSWRSSLSCLTATAFITASVSLLASLAFPKYSFSLSLSSIRYFPA